MVLSLMQVELRIPENRSLKGKRMILRSIKDRVRNKFNVSISEIDNHDLWENATIGVAFVGTDQNYAHKILTEVVTFVQSFPQIQLVDYMIEML